MIRLPSRFLLLALALCSGAMLCCNTAEARRRARTVCCKPQPRCCPQPTCHQQPLSQLSSTSCSTSKPYPFTTAHAHNSGVTEIGSVRPYGCHCHSGSCRRARCDNDCVARHAPACVAACQSDPSGAACIACLAGTAVICCELDCSAPTCHCHW